ncbi:MAG TPA: hypothetical protein VFI11_03705 [Anaerolineales bacterium]|nr:hypothetical protein [Anaerolineales bacterium]
MEIFQDQGVIQTAVVIAGVLLAWWLLRGIWRWIRRLSRFGCLAGLALLAAAFVLVRLT